MKMYNVIAEVQAAVKHSSNILCRCEENSENACFSALQRIIKSSALNSVVDVCAAGI